VRRLRFVLALAALAALPAGTRAQAPDSIREPGILITLPPPTRRATEPAAVRAVRMLSEHATRELLASGFPARLHFRLELWEARSLFDKLVSQVEWDVVVRYDPLARHYTVTRGAGRVTPLGTFADLKDAEDAVAKAFTPEMTLPTARKKYYYFASLEVEMLSVGDLDEVERWLKGEAGPATKGQEDAGTALGRGAKTLFTRLLGGQVRRYSSRTAAFRFEVSAAKE
jgi:hypothetical protein